MLKDLAVLFKLRLTFVVLSAVLLWFMGTEALPFLLELTMGGYLLTGASMDSSIMEKADAKWAGPPGVLAPAA